MSNIHTAAAWHGLDDEPNSDGTSDCRVCYNEAKKQFFSRRYHRRGQTLRALYIQIHNQAHDY